MDNPSSRVWIPLEGITASLESRRFPPMIILDVTNVCNLQCIHCPQPAIQGRAGFEITHLGYVAFRELVDQLGDCSDPCLVRFVGDGEPMLHPQIGDMIGLVKRRRPFRGAF